MDIRQLRYFLAVAEELNFSRAARKLHMAQPPLSMQIRALEADLGFALFERTNRVVRLSAQGHAFLPRAREVLEAAMRARSAAADIAQGRSGFLRIGVVPPACTAAIAVRFREFRETYPDVSLVVRQDGAIALRRELEDGNLDLIVTRETSGGDAGIRELEIEKHRHVLAMPSGHPLASQEKVRLRDLAGVRMVLIDWRSVPGYGKEIVVLCERLSIPVQIDFAAHDLHTMIWLVSAGFGICPYPSSLVEDAPAGVEFRPFSPQLPRLSLRLEWRARQDSEVLRHFVELFRRSGARAGT